MAYEINYPGIFVPALTNYPYITEGKYVKGGYIVVSTVSDLESLNTKALVDGVPAYVASTKKAYRYTLANGWANEELPEEVKSELEAELTALASTIRGEISSSVNNEKTARENADAILQGNINTEADTRSRADITLQDNINAEALARSNADTALGNRVTTNEGDISTMKENITTLQQNDNWVSFS